MPNFPKRLTLDLLDIEREMLDWLAERLPQKSAKDIVDGIFARGLVTIVGEEREKEGRVVQGQRQTASALNVRADKIPFSKPKYRPPSPIPDTLVVRLDDELRDRLERVLLSEHGSSLESLVEAALRTGVQEMQRPGALDPAPVFEALKGKEASTRPTARQRRRRLLVRLCPLASR